MTLQGVSGSSTVTASGGSFAFSVITPGNYTIIASKTGYIQTNTTLTVHNTNINDAGTITINPITVSERLPIIHQTRSMALS